MAGAAACDAAQFRPAPASAVRPASYRPNRAWWSRRPRGAHGARVALTDSGGVRDEAAVLYVPSFTLPLCGIRGAPAPVRQTCGRRTSTVGIALRHPRFAPRP